MSEEKVKVNMRLGMRVREAVVTEAAGEGLRVGTMTNLILQEELAKMMKVGADNCVMADTKEYYEKVSAITASRDTFYILPPLKDIEAYIGTSLDDKQYPQVSLYFTNAQIELMQEIAKKQRIATTIESGRVKSYRYIVMGMLLNNPVCRSLNVAAK